MVRLTIYSKSSLWGEMGKNKSGHLSIFTVLKHLMVQIFQGFIFTPYQRH